MYGDGNSREILHDMPAPILSLRLLCQSDKIKRTKFMNGDGNFTVSLLSHVFKMTSVDRELSAIYVVLMSPLSRTSGLQRFNASKLYFRWARRNSSILYLNIYNH